MSGLNAVYHVDFVHRGKEAIVLILELAHGSLVGINTGVFDTSHPACNLHKGPLNSLPRPNSLPHSFANVIPKPFAHSSPSSQSMSTASHYKSTTLYITTIPLPIPTYNLASSLDPLPHSFANAISQHSVRFPPNWQYSQPPTSLSLKGQPP